MGFDQQCAEGCPIHTFVGDVVLNTSKGKKYYFTDAKLEDVCPVSTRWYGVKVVLDNQDIGNQRFTGMIYRCNPVQVVLNEGFTTN
jgi:hypothetical protein